MATDISICSLNVRGITEIKKRNTVFTWLKENKYNVCFLQETFCTPAAKTQFQKYWRGDVFHSVSNSPHSRGVCILLSRNFSYNIISTHSDEDGRIVLLNLEIDNNEYTFVNIYAPNKVSDRISFFKHLKNFIDIHSLNKNRLFIGGDFNCVLVTTDRISGKTDSSKCALEDFVKTYNLVDCWKHFNPNSKGYTYIDPSRRMRNSRIDYIFCSSPVKPLCISSCICQAPAPDHKAVYLHFKTSFNKRGKGYWKFNNSFLSERDFEVGVKELYMNILSKYDDDDVPRYVLWEFIKLKIKEYCITYGIKRAKMKKDSYNELQIKLNELDEKLAENNCETMFIKRREIKQKLDDYYREKSEGYQIRSRVKWVEDGEQSTKYFLNLEKGRQNYNRIISLKNVNMETVTTDEEILDVAKVFYSDLFKSKNVSDSSVNCFFNDITPENVLTEDLVQKCEGALTCEECCRAIDSMKGNKSPGIDGLTVEFYKYFWPLVGDLLVATFNECYDKGILADSQRMSVLSLIFKKGNTDDISNYRPISLTNVDYRILSFVLSNRLQNVIDSIVNHDQTAYIKNRYMGYNVRLIQDIVDHYKNSDKGGIIFTSDFQKAFDSLEWKFLLNTLDFFKFGPSFKQWIKTIYNSPVCMIKNNGYLSDKFSISRGVRQGCPVSALLFVLCIEILGVKIRQHEELRGFDLGFPQKMVKIVQYADDCVLCFNNKTEFCIALDVFKNFGKVSGLVLNLSKCEGLWLGVDKYKQQGCSLFGIKWPEQIRCLGIYIGYCDDKNKQKNWYDRINCVESIFKSWQKRDISLFGRVQIIKTFAISQFILQASLLAVPPDVIKKLETMFFQFLWRSKDRVKRRKVIQGLKYGGLSMVDVNVLFMSLKAVWISRLLKCDPDVYSWAQLPCIYYKSFFQANSNLVFNFDNDVEFAEMKSLSPFYRDALLFYNTAYVSNLKDFKDNIFDQCLWANKYISVRKNNKKCVLFLRNWIRSGVNKIRDLMLVDGKLDVNYIFTKVTNKSNILAEIKLVQRALQPYVNELKEIILANTEKQEIMPIKSRFFYKQLCESRFLSLSLPMYLSPYCDNEYDEEDVVSMFTSKLIKEIEIKIREFNFKLLHGILPCNVNLKKWKIKASDICDVCNNPQTIEHLLFECSYVKPIWSLVGEICNVEITYKKLLGFEKDFVYNNFVSLICFLIYKEWLLLSLQSKKRNTCINLLFFKHELKLRLTIYENCARKFPLVLKNCMEKLINMI